ncbi:hypothetical protein PR048_017391 [Dryococelus australis]|uniref:Uncharacterized protein n=1 Tax=Dryococelus australis TaxID=614101 RepID=A0ABQ9H9D5_9NEOP|nr:hypothetical protein PR048_017391 [Dryococelus australis]
MKELKEKVDSLVTGQASQKEKTDDLCERFERLENRLNLQNVAKKLATGLDRIRECLGDQLVELETRLTEVERRPEVMANTTSEPNVLTQVDLQLMNFEKHLNTKLTRTEVECLEAKRSKLSELNSLSRLAHASENVSPVTVNSEVTNFARLASSTGPATNQGNTTDHPTLLNPITAVLHHPAKHWV